MGIYYQESETVFTEHIPNLLQNLPKAYHDTYPKVIEATQTALTAVTAIPKVDSSKGYISDINNTLDTAGVAEYLPGPGFNVSQLTTLQTLLLIGGLSCLFLAYSRVYNRYCRYIVIH